jgi:hypothetical protein
MRVQTLVICVSNGYTLTMPGKDVGLRTRVERSLRDKFLEVCRLQDKPAAQVLREFMRNYVTYNGSGAELKSQEKGGTRVGQQT